MLCSNNAAIPINLYSLVLATVGLHDREHIEVSSSRKLINWLAKHHASSPGVWLVTYKKSSGQKSPSYDEIVRAVLCFGWIDSIPGKVDENRSKLYISPRKPNSPWSKPNKDRVAELIEQGKMQPAGLAIVEKAKADGSWNRIDSAHKLEIPMDLIAAFKKHQGSAKYFEAFPPGVKKQILEWISLAKTDATRAKRVSETAELAAQNLRANQWNRPTR